MNPGQGHFALSGIFYFPEVLQYEQYRLTFLRSECLIVQYEIYRRRLQS